MQRPVHSTPQLSHGVVPLTRAALVALSFACSPGTDVDDGITVDRPSNLPNGGAGGMGPNTPPPPPQTVEEELYQRPPPPDCGDFDRGMDEACDDGNRTDGDGCSSNCLVVENGYTCDGPGGTCALVELCGDSRRVLSEGCDDGNAGPGDGCASNCQPESGYACPTPGEPCVSTTICGDGFIATGEGCDDANLVAGDGCSATCALEPGWECLIPGAKCRPICGDGVLTGNERCDDANSAEPGCSDICRLEPGFVCDEPGQPCEVTDCLNGELEGSEQCDDGNLVPYDGCSSVCINEPDCGIVNGAYICAAVCGDGQKFPEEACDDGNTQPDDGCSPTCEFEAGYACTNQAAELGLVLPLPIIYRDFTNAHPHFEIDPLGSGRLPEMVLPTLGANGKPEYNPAFTFNNRAWTLDGAKPANGPALLANDAAIAARFAQWYTDVPGQNEAVVATLDLNLNPGDGSFQFAASGLDQFFPLDGRGLGNQGTDAAGVPHNFHFTSEVRQWFEYQGGELLQFSGDDDVWVFVNGQLTVDLGGIHSELFGSIELLGADGGDSELCIGLDCAPFPVTMNPNGVNEIAVFQAERHVTESNYTLTLRGFNAPVTTCQSTCGDGVVTPDETCDEGMLNGTGYNRCSVNCTPGPRCGDGLVEETEEQCDNGSNRDGYVVSDAACAPGCRTPSRCGDAVIDAAFGEQCDDGNNDGSYGGCSPACLLGPRCGDGQLNGAETCDDGNRRNTDGCNVNCDLERDPA